MDPIKSLLDATAGWPDWLLVAVVSVAAALALYVIAKLIKWSLYLLIIVVLVAGIGTAVWMLLS